MRRYGLAAAALFVFVGGAPAQADGLEKFEQLIKPDIPAGTLKYKSGKALGDNGFVLEDVVVTPPPDQTNKAEPVNIKRIAVELLRSGGLNGMHVADLSGDAFRNFVVDRHVDPDGVVRFYLRPKVPFGA